MNRLLSVCNDSKRIVPTLATVYFVEVCDFYNFFNSTLELCLLKGIFVRFRLACGMDTWKCIELKCSTFKVKCPRH